MTTIPQDNTPRKQCTGPCGQFLPATTEYFHRDRHNSDGLYSQCKGCKNKKAEAHRARPEVKERMSAYNKIYHEKYYSQPENHEHKRIQDKAYYEHNRIDIRAQAKLYYRRPEVYKHLRAQAKEYNSRLEVREHRLARQRVYRSNPEVRERERAKNREYGRTPEGHAIRNAVRRNYHARKKVIPGTHTAAQLQDLLKRQKYRCYYCSARFEKRNGRHIYHVDHTFPISRVDFDIPANDISYLVLSCPTCNLSKGDKFPWEFHKGGKLL